MCGPLNTSHVWGMALGHLQVRDITFVGALGWQHCALNVPRGPEPRHVSQGQMAVVRDIQGVGALLSGAAGLTEASEDRPRGPCGGPGVFLKPFT